MFDALANSANPAVELAMVSRPKESEKAVLSTAVPEVSISPAVASASARPPPANVAVLPEPSVNVVPRLDNGGLVPEMLASAPAGVPIRPIRPAPARAPPPMTVAANRAIRTPSAEGRRGPGAGAGARCSGRGRTWRVLDGA